MEPTWAVPGLLYLVQHSNETCEANGGYMRRQKQTTSLTLSLCQKNQSRVVNLLFLPS